MKTNLIILAVIILLTGLVTVFATQLQPNQPVNANLGSAPDFAYHSLDGKNGRLYDHTGKVILLHFWATWCPPCIVEFPQLLDLAESQKDNFIILAISTDTEKADIERFYKKLNRQIPENFMTIWDVDKSITQVLYQSMKLPESILIKHNMTINEKIVGPQENWNSSKWHRKIKSLSVRKSVNN